MLEVTVAKKTGNDQNVLDMMHNDPRRARASLGNMIPTSTGAAKVIGKIIPELQGKLDGWAMRVPTPDVSAVYLVAQLKRDTSVEEVNAALKKASEEGRLSKYLDYTEELLVSSDFLGNPHSAIVDASLTKVINGRQVAVVAWYDNEWAYSNRVVELVNYLIGQESPNPKTASSPMLSSSENLDSPLNPGGIDLAGIKVEATPESVPVNIPLLDMHNFAGFSFQIVNIEEIKDLNAILNFRVEEKKEEKQELALHR